MKMLKSVGLKLSPCLTPVILKKYLNVMRQSTCLVINPITVDGYATLFNCTPVDRASDSMMVLEFVNLVI